MKISRRTALSLLAAPAIWKVADPARAAEGAPVKIGLLGDLSSAYADITGTGSVVAARMAIEDFGPCLGRPVEFVAADCQLKADISSSLARQWWDTEGVDAIVDMPSSAVALAISQLGREKKKIVLVTSAGSSALTGANCSPYTTHWVQDSYATAKTLTRAIVDQGGDSWFFIAADYLYGASLVTDTSAVLETVGGKVVGTVRAPLGTGDFSSFLLQAQSSGAKVIALANGGSDTINCIKQAGEFGLRDAGQKLVALNFMDPDAKSLGLEAAQGTLFCAAFYWDRTDRSRAWSRRFHAQTQRMPTSLQAGVYSQISHYLQAVQKAGTKDADAVARTMREMPVRDMFAEGQVRADGRMVHDMYLAQVKKPSESREPWDQFKLLATVPGNEAYRSIEAGGCKLAI